MIRSCCIGVLFQLLAATTLIAAPNDAPPLKIHMIGVGEYKPVESLTEFKKHLEKLYRVEITTSFSLNASEVNKSGKGLPNMDSLKTADVLVLFARRMNLPEEQMAIVRNHWDKGKPIVSMRTASHAFQEADIATLSQVIGGVYSGAGDYTTPFKAIPTDEQAKHPILQGVEPITSKGYYNFKSVAKESIVLQVNDEPARKVKRPVSWVHTYKEGRMFYTSMGTPEDFKDANFVRLLTNAIFWTAKSDLEKMRK